ncbi:DNA polymerase-3 subunit gamma/tau [Actinoplanes octamycinicus]|uniref:DNA polymerase III subunit gamma/tau n=1 Tax=Actinoplanes octamycinicus TaxID=135948 RepID=A0A7W7GTD6_9ACTN|nr:DNA polymerase III subunit gamma and tau [Actinoplanes octamycinicus]MBB4737872.1 DNA polymerase-3 subunit gamma/tau [Actinoplanes octamycinicus]GIE59076.1 hypothetical protein Aoc01nite_44780 [Actinoplanes octamycinicus]
MALALYRKYRPRTFAEVIGQEHVTEPLSQALRSGRLNHAYLFSGPRGCGKTSSARILARSLNCEQGPTPDPCGVCASCKSLANDGAGSIDVIEIDAASHGGVDDARELREKAFFAPASSRYKIYVIDEAHMVSSAGFNALLKLVEEPPDYVKFIFATTEPDKVLGTIRSRTHHYPFRLIPPATLRPYLQQLTDAEGITVDPAVFPLVVRAGGGSARDTLSVLDQLIAGAGPEGVSYARAVALLGVTDVALIDEMCDALAAGDGAAAYSTIDRVAEAGHDPRRFASDLLERLRDLIVLQQVPDAVAKGLIDGPADQLEAMHAQATRLGAATLSRSADIVHNGLVEMRGTTAPRLLLELITARMLLPGADDSTGALLQRLERLERRGPLPAADPSDVRGEQPAVAPAPAGVTPEAAAPAGAGGGGLAAARAAAAAARRAAGGPARPVSPAPVSSAPAASAPVVPAPAVPASAAEAVVSPVPAAGASAAGETPAAPVVSPSVDAAEGAPAAGPSGSTDPDLTGSAPVGSVPAASGSAHSASAAGASPAAPAAAPDPSAAGPDADWNQVADGAHPEPADYYDDEPPWDEEPPEDVEPPRPQVDERLAKVRTAWQSLGRQQQRVQAMQDAGIGVRELRGDTVVFVAPSEAIADRFLRWTNAIATEFGRTLGGRWQIHCEVGTLTADTPPRSTPAHGTPGAGASHDSPGAGPSQGSPAAGRDQSTGRDHAAARRTAPAAATRPAAAPVAAASAAPERNTGRTESRPSRPQRAPADADDDGPAAPRPVSSPPPADRAANPVAPASPAPTEPTSADGGDTDWPEPVRPGTAAPRPAAPAPADDGWPEPVKPGSKAPTIHPAAAPAAGPDDAAPADPWAYSAPVTAVGNGPESSVASAAPDSWAARPGPASPAASEGWAARPGPPSPAASEGWAAQSGSSVPAVPGGEAAQTGRVSPAGPAVQASPAMSASVTVDTSPGRAASPAPAGPPAATANSAAVTKPAATRPAAPARSAAMEAARAAAARGGNAGGGLAAARAAARNAGANRSPAGPATGQPGNAQPGGAAWADGTPIPEAPYDPEYDGPPPTGAGYEGFDPGDEPLDEVIDEKTARQSSEEQAFQLLRDAFGAEKIGEM